MIGSETTSLPARAGLPFDDLGDAGAHHGRDVQLLGHLPADLVPPASSAIPELAGAPDPAWNATPAACRSAASGLLTLPYWNAAQTPHWDSQGIRGDAGLAGLPHPRALLPVVAGGHRLRVAHAARRFGGRAGERVEVHPRHGRRGPQRAVDADPGRRLRPPTRGARHRRDQRARRGRRRADGDRRSTRRCPRPRPQWPEPTRVVEPRPRVRRSYGALRASLRTRLLRRPATSLHDLHDLPD